MTKKMDKLPKYLTNAAEQWHYIYVDCAIAAAQATVGEDEIIVPKNWAELKDSFMNHFLRCDYKAHLMSELRKIKYKE